MAKHLNLSEEQVTKMKELRTRYHNETRDLKYNIAMKKLEMRKLSTDPKTSDSMLLAKQKELNGQRIQLMEKRGQMRIEWRKILTTEQIAKLDRMPHKGHGKRHGGCHS